jgi:hypothetical protein
MLFVTIAAVIGLKSERHKPSYRSAPLRMPDDYLRPIEPLIGIVLSCMRWKNAFSSS